ncbi:DUF2089 domain-containing protein [Anaerosporobacter faecicola]|uniref:DUF2089 domain-containing protein n=1 Tax=Anaerosporobacter faecicola TaxID=2718714 RepID=UPI001438D0E3|nr:DUF2089 family protein [Anaerosporobacter faecicola]
MQHTEIIGHCPICHEKLIATRLTCKHCGLELTNNFAMSKFNYLDYEDLHFIDNYLKCRGNLKELMQLMDLSYPAAKKRLDQVLDRLGYGLSGSNGDTIEVIIDALPIYKDESIATKRIKEKLNACKGIATLPLSNNKTFFIYYEEFEGGIYASNLPKGSLLTWKAFDSVMELLKKSNGRSSKGNAMKAKLGEPGLTLDTVEGYVAYNAYGVALGESVLRRISAISSILEWCGLCKNGYGYLELFDHVSTKK